MSDHSSSLDAIVKGVIRRVLEDRISSDVALDTDVSLLTLGFDSLSFVDLTVALEDTLGVQEFPMQRWADAEFERPAPRFSLGSLIAACRELLETGRFEGRA